MATSTSTTSYLDPPQLIGKQNADGTISLTPLELKRLNDYNYYVAKLIQGGLNLANLNKETQQTFTDLEGNVTEVTETASGLTVSVSNLSGAVSTISATVDGLSVADETGSYTIIDGDKLTSFDSSTLSWVIVENGQVVLLTQGQMVVGGLYFDANESKIILKSDWFMPLKIVSSSNISIDANGGGLVAIGTSNNAEQIDIGSSTATVNIDGTVNHNGVPLGAAVFT